MTSLLERLGSLLESSTSMGLRASGQGFNAPRPTPNVTSKAPKKTESKTNQEKNINQRKELSRKQQAVGDQAFGTLEKRWLEDPVTQSQVHSLYELRKKIDSFIESPIINTNPLMRFGDLMTRGQYNLAERFPSESMSRGEKMKLVSDLEKTYQSSLYDVQKAKNQFIDAQLGGYTQTGSNLTDQTTTTTETGTTTGGESSGGSGSWADDLTPRQIQQARVQFAKSPDKKKAQVANEYLKALKLYEDSIKDGIAWTGKKRASQQGYYNDVVMRYKDAKELGAITGPDLDLMRQAMALPSIINPISQAEYVLSGGHAGILEQIAAQRDIANRDFETIYKILKNEVTPGVTDSQYRELGEEWKKWSGSTGQLEEFDPNQFME